MKKYIVSFLVASIFLAGAPFTVQQVSAADLNIRDFINLLVAIGVITPDKMPAVNAFLATLNNPTPVTPTLPTPVISLINNKLPVIKSISDNGGVSGDTITIYGENLKNPNGDTLVQFLYRGVDAGGVYASSVKSDGTQVKFNLNGIIIANSAPVDQLRISYGPAFPNATKSNVINFTITLDVATPVVPPVVSQPSITVLSPNGGENFSVGKTYNITWNYSGVDKVNVWLLAQINGRETKAPIATNINANSSHYSWRIGDLDSNNVKYKIGVLSTISSQNDLSEDWDWSDGFFTINESSVVIPPVVTEPSITSLSVGSGLPGTLISVFGKNLYNPSSPYNVTFNDPTHDNGVPGSAMTNGSTLTFAVPRLPAGPYTITLENTQGQRSNTVSFTITAPDSQSSVTVTSPNGGEVFNSGDIHRIEWSAPSSITSVAIMLKDSNGTGDWIQFSMPNTGYYDWTVKKWNTVNTQFKVFITGYPAGNAGNPVDSSDSYFTIN